MNKIFNYNDFLLNEKKSEKRIYFFHPKTTSETNTEDKGTELINLYFDSPLIYGVGDLRGNFFKFVDDINSVVVLPYLNGKISPKTYKRLVYAFERSIDVYYMHPNKYKIIKVEDLEFFTEKTMDVDEWKEQVEQDDIDSYFTEVQ